MKVILASNNKNKIREMQQILAPFGMEVISQKEAGADFEVEENGTTFAENAELKARAVYERLGVPVIADDSGLAVDALNGAPGVYSHRYAGENATDEERCQKLLCELKNVPAEQRTARFLCEICYLDENGDKHFFTGSCEGFIGTEPKGSNGFGYDPVFCSGDKTLAEMTDEEKNRISHRGKALRLFQAYLKERNTDVDK
ncbi:MAG: XTP/dITP diphosphatase [Ruminococcus sp.]|nr:XTP/dITP diphosphatase [Ruminococcus sp.]